MSRLFRMGVCALVVLAALPARADGVRGISPDGKKGWLHTVEKGDTLWDITEKYIGSPWIWPSVWKDNEIENPHVINPGDLIWITETEMRKLTPEEVAQIRFPGDAPPAGAEPVEPGDEPVLLLPPPAREPEPQRGDPFAALDTAGQETARVIEFPGLHRMGFISENELSGAAAVLGSHDENYWSSQERTTIVGIGEGKVHIGDMFTLFRTRRRISHPETGVVLGYVIERLGKVEVTEIHEESSFVRVLRAYAEIEPGDRLVPYVEEEDRFVTKRASQPIEGSIVATQIYRQYSLNGDLVMIDCGLEAGVEPGIELEVFRGGREVRDPVTTLKTLVPDDIVGRLMVVKAEPNTSLALLMRAERPIRVGDRFRSR